MVRNCIAILAASAAITLPASAAVLAVGHGSGNSPEAADADARSDLALRLQRRVEVRIEGATGKAAASLRRAIGGGRELPLIEVELAGAGSRGGAVLREARLTDESLAAYEREARRLEQRLRALEPARFAASQKTAEGFADWFARIDQYRRVSAVLGLFASKVQTEIELDEAGLWSFAAKTLSPVGGAKDVARLVRLGLDRAGIAGVRVIAPVRADTAEVTALSVSIADEFRGALPAGRLPTAAHTLDGWYARIDGRILLTLFLLDASFNTQRAFVFVLPAAIEQSSRALAAASGFAETLTRGLVRVEMPAGGKIPPSSPGAAGDAIEVGVRMGRGNRGLYYRPGDRDRLLVKLDRPGYYYIVGHVEKANSRFSYLMEIGERGASNRFVRRVGAGDARRWLSVGEFTVEAPVGLEAVQVFATSGPPERMLPATRFDPNRNLHVIGTDPVDAVKRTRGLVLVNIPDSRKDPGTKAEPKRFAIGEAVLQFSTLQ
jgi:hypothetical protein